MGAVIGKSHVWPLAIQYGAGCCSGVSVNTLPVFVHSGTLPSDREILGASFAACYCHIFHHLNTARVFLSTLTRTTTTWLELQTVVVISAELMYVLTVKDMIKTGSRLTH